MMDFDYGYSDKIPKKAINNIYTKEYQEITSRLDIMIRQLEPTDIDISSIVNEYNKIIYEQNDSSNIPIKIVASELPKDIIQKKIFDLKLLEDKIKLYLKYAIILNKLKEMNFDKQLSKSEIDNYVNKIIEILTEIRQIDSINLNDGRSVKDEIYNITYELIKLELAYTAGSRLYQYVIQNKDNLSYFYQLTKEDIERLNMQSSTSNIFHAVSMDMVYGIKSDYFCIENLMTIIMYNPKYKKIISSNISIIAEICKFSFENSQDMISSSIEHNARYNKVKEEFIKNRSKLRKNVVSIALVISILTGGAYGMAKLAKKNQDTKVELVGETTRVYSTLDNELTTQISYLEEVEDEDTKVTLEVYKPWDISSEVPSRKVIKYDITNLTLDTIYDYLSYDYLNSNDSSNVNITSETITEDYELDKDKYQEEYMIVTEKTYFHNGSTKEHKVKSLLLSYECLYLSLCMATINLIFALFSGKANPGHYIKNLIKLAEFTSIDRKLSKKELQVLKENLLQTLEFIKRHDELTSEFNRLILTYKPILDNFDEYGNLYNSMYISPVTKSKIKELANEHHIK